MPVQLEKGKDYIVFVGRISIEKSLDILALAMKEVFKTHPDARWLVIGHGPYERELKQLINKLGIAGKTKMTGAIPNHDLLGSGLLAQCRISATASKSETQGLSIIEGEAVDFLMSGERVSGLVLGDGS